ncbi:unannotated protein [freshwater metagenome]|uniref:Unannotated protein n=1 Tax=freshwater metagenome TaxID=449393 RepID=A0A6J6GQL1_9ZZZZ
MDQWSPVLRGWVLGVENPLEPLEIAIMIDGIEACRTRCDLPRPDVANAGHGTGNCGFAVSLRELVSDDLPHALEVVDVGTGETIFRSEALVVVHSTWPNNGSQQMLPGTVRSESGSWESFERRVASGRRVAIVATHRTEGASELGVRRLVEALSSADNAVLVVDTSPAASSDALGADFLMWRENLGWDFASWATGLERLGDLAAECDHLLLVNDSCVGPFGDLGPLIARGQSLGVDVWSLTDSWESGHHLQSYFLGFTRSALGQGVLSDFFDQYPFPKYKEGVIEHGEVGLTAFLDERGITTAAVFEYFELVASFEKSLDPRLTRFADSTTAALMRKHDPDYQTVGYRSLVATVEDLEMRVPLNPTHHFWRELLDQGFPFIKRELLVADPAGRFFASDFADVVRPLLDEGDLELFRSEFARRPTARIVDAR